MILSSLVQLATINHQVSSEALDVLLGLLSSLHGKSNSHELIMYMYMGTLCVWELFVFLKLASYDTV